MIYLSHSSISMLYKASHNWINKQMGLTVPDNEHFKAGREAHRVIQDHVAGIKKDIRLDFLTDTFDIVETVDFDPKCKIQFKLDDTFSMIGYFDGYNTITNRSLEIKTAAEAWSLGQFQKSMQRRIYAIAKPETVVNVLITAPKDQSKWSPETIKTYEIPVTDEDKAEAMAWIKGGIEIIKRGDFNGGLTDGRCLDRFCYYGENCFFKA